MNNLSDKKKSIISWGGYGLSTIIFIILIVLSFSPADSNSELTFTIVKILNIVLGIISILITIISIIFFKKLTTNSDKSFSYKALGFTLRILLLILETVLWVTCIIPWTSI